MGDAEPLLILISWVVVFLLGFFSNEPYDPEEKKRKK